MPISFVQARPVHCWLLGIWPCCQRRLPHRGARTQPATRTRMASSSSGAPAHASLLSALPEWVVEGGMQQTRLLASLKGVLP
jgi:hypothetical protein